MQEYEPSENDHKLTLLSAAVTGEQLKVREADFPEAMLAWEPTVKQYEDAAGRLFGDDLLRTVMLKNGTTSSWAVP